MDNERENQLAFIPKAAAKRARPGLEMVSEVENHVRADDNIRLSPVAPHEFLLTCLSKRRAQISVSR